MSEFMSGLAIGIALTNIIYIVALKALGIS